MSRYFIELTQPEIKAQFERHPLVILPCGSVEQHGAHLPTGTDIFAANSVSHAVAEQMDGVVLPGGPLGVTPMHMPYEATISADARNLSAGGDRNLPVDGAAWGQKAPDRELARRI